MLKLRYRFAVAAIVMAGALFLLTPTFMPQDMAPSGAARINLGLDLKGGVQLTLGVDTDKAVQAALTHSGQMLRQKARDQGLTVLGPRQLPDGTEELVVAKADQLPQILHLIKTDTPHVVPGIPRTSTDGAVHLPYAFTPDFTKQTRALAVDQVLRTISSRIDQFGVAEPDIRKQQGDRILIQLPGLTNVTRAVQLVKQAAALSFHLVRDDLAQGYALPPGVALYPMKERNGERLDFRKLREITFDVPDTDTFQGLPLAIEASRIGGSMLTVFNAANERAGPLHGQPVFLASWSGSLRNGHGRTQGQTACHCS